MKHIFLDRRPDGLALYLYGDLQFHERDERLYHAPLAWVPVALAARRFPNRGLRVLILGGGDGLALREVLSFPEVSEVHVVDLDPAVLRLGREELAALNERAFEDPRVRVHVRDARGFISGARGFAAVVNDFTFPRDAAGAALFSSDFFRRERAALADRGVLAVNGVSPENTPEAFDCVGATLEAAGFSVLPYAREIPSFRREGYGRWGFFFGSTEPVAERELAGLPWRGPDGLGAAGFMDGVRSAREAGSWRAQPNLSGELLHYLRGGPTAPGAARLSGGAQGFAAWLKADEGRRSLEELLGALPLARRDRTRESLLEWGQHAERLFQGADVKAYADALLRRTRRLPAAWAAELRALRDRLSDGLPPMRELLTQAYRVFAILMIVLLLANLFFPDNLYAKGYYGGSGGGGGFDMSYTSYGGSPFHFHGYRYYGRVYDANGRAYPPVQFAFSDPTQGTQRVSSKLALTSTLQLLDSGAVAYSVPVADFRFYVEPGRLRVLNAAGQETAVLAPPPELESAVRGQVASQKELIEKALPDHERWLQWVGWAAFTDEVSQGRDELRELKDIRRALDAAAVLWQAGAPASPFTPDPRWIPLFPGVYLAPATAPSGAPEAFLVAPGGKVRSRSFAAAKTPTDEDRFLAALLERYKAAPASRPSW